MPILTQSQITEIIEELKLHTKVKGILLTGSYAYGQPNDESDIEIVCITNDGSDFVEFDRKFFGVEAELFFNTSDKIRNTYWANAIKEGHGDCVHFWANGKIMHDLDGTVKALQQEARELWLKGPPNRPDWEWRWGKHKGGYPKGDWELA